jgi:hypothetical protein
VPKDPPLTFPTSVGTTWVYERKSVEETIVISEVKEERDGAKRVTTEKVEKGGKRTPHAVMSISARGVFVVSEVGEVYDSPWCLLKLPHRPGQSWEVKTRGGAFLGDGTMTARPVETVREPAGEFSAARVVRKLALVERRPEQVTYWFADGVGLIQTDDGLRLKSFTPGK